MGEREGENLKEKRGGGAVYEEKDFQSEKRGDGRNISSNRICIRAARTRSPLPGASTSRIQRNLKLRRFHVVRQKGALQMVWQRWMRKGMQIGRIQKGSSIFKGRIMRNPEFSENCRANRRERHNRVYLMAHSSLSATVRNTVF